MKKVLGLFAIALSLASCTAEPLPSDLMLNGSSNVNHYSFDWDSNQQDTHATYSLYIQGVANKIEVKDRHFEIDIPTNRIFRFWIEDTTVRPLCSLKISMRKPMNLQSGVYEPNNYTVLFNEAHNVNYFNFGATTNKDGSLRID